jgi:hypothetical protein
MVDPRWSSQAHQAGGTSARMTRSRTLPARGAIFARRLSALRQDGPIHSCERPSRNTWHPSASRHQLHACSLLLLRGASPQTLLGDVAAACCSRQSIMVPFPRRSTACCRFERPRWHRDRFRFHRPRRTMGALPSPRESPSTLEKGRGFSVFQNAVRCSHPSPLRRRSRRENSWLLVSSPAKRRP